jgi:hypothetical protein
VIAQVQAGPPIWLGMTNMKTRPLMAAFAFVAACATAGGDGDEGAEDLRALPPADPPAPMAGAIASEPAEGETPAAVEPPPSALGDPGWALWSRADGGSGNDTAIGVSIDPSGNSYTTGYFSGTIDLGCGPLVPTGFDLFLAKHDPDGMCLWASVVDASDAAAGIGVAADATGVYLAATLSGSASFGGDVLTALGGYDTVLARYTDAGAHVWSVGMGSDGDDLPAGLASDAGGAVLTGLFYGSGSFGGATLTSAGAGDVYVARYSAAGAHVWSSRFGGPGEDGGTAVAIAGSTTHVGGSFEQTVNFGAGPWSAGSVDGFVLTLDANGGYQSGRQIGGGGMDAVSALAVVGGDLVVGGYFQGAIDLDEKPLEATWGYWSGFVARYSGGTLVWATEVVASGASLVSGLAVDASGDVALAGQFAGAFQGLTAAGVDDLLVAKLAGADGTFMWAAGFGGAGSVLPSAVASQPDGDVVAAGNFDDAVDVGADSWLSAGGLDILLVAVEN